MSGVGDDYIDVNEELAAATARAFSNLNVGGADTALSVSVGDSAFGETILPTLTPSGRLSVSSSITSRGLLETFRTPPISNRTPPAITSTSGGSLVSARLRLPASAVGTVSVPSSVLGGG